MAKSLKCGGRFLHICSTAIYLRICYFSTLNVHLVIDFISKESSIVQALLSTITFSSFNLQNLASHWADLFVTWFRKIKM